MSEKKKKKKKSLGGGDEANNTMETTMETGLLPFPSKCELLIWLIHIMQKSHSTILTGGNEKNIFYYFHIPFTDYGERETGDDKL